MSSLECDVLAVMSEWSVEYPTDQLERWEEVWDWIFEKTYCLKEKYVVTRSGEAVSRDCCDGFLDPYSTRETHWLVERHSTPENSFLQEVRTLRGRPPTLRCRDLRRARRDRFLRDSLAP
nr:uncharacterized protein LOC124214942 [Neodiprion pinetum]